MELHPLLILTCFTLAMVASHAAMSPENYWRSKLPNTPMPKALRGFLSLDGGSGTNVTSKGYWSSGIIPQGAYYGGAPHRINSQKVAVYYGGAPPKADKVQYNPNVTLYFLEKDINPGTTMNLNLTKMSYTVTFLPRQFAESIPFSSNKLPEIFDKFSVKPGSTEARIITETIKDCEAPGIKGEDKYCVTSLESMIDFSISKLGKNPQAISTEVEKQTNMQKYSIKDGVKKMSGNTSVVCHVQSYAYAVFYCHELKATSAYMFPLEDPVDGTKIKAVAVCHKDTSGWNPQHLAFQLLKVKPGTTVPICHVLDEGNIVWVPQ